MRKRTFGMAGPKWRGERSDHAKRGRNRCDGDLSGKPLLEGIDLLPHRAGVADDAPRPVERALSFRGKALEPRSALHQHDAEDFLELLEAGRHRRLGDATGLGGAPEMTFLGQREQQFKLVDQKEPHYFRHDNTTVAVGQTCQKPRSIRLCRPIEPISFCFRIGRFDVFIDRISVSQHETALLISGSIPILMGSVISL